MSRGRPPTKALALATGIAEKRGEVQYFLQAPGLICNFVIYLAGLVAHVRVMRVRQLRCTLTWLEREVADALAGLRMIASSPAISRELWICSPRGIFRFFRIESSGLVELDRDGRPLPDEKPISPKREAGTGKRPAKMSVSVAPDPAATTLVRGVTNGEPVLAGGASVGEGGLAGHREGEKT